MMTVAEFIAKWRKAELKERSAAQEYFIDLCHVFEHPTPAAVYAMTLLLMTGHALTQDTANAGIALAARAHSRPALSDHREEG